MTTPRPEEEWEELDEDELPPRPRNRLLAPLPLVLIAVLIAATGFLGGVLMQKGSEGGGSAGGPPGGLPSFLSEGAGEGSGSEGASGLPAGFPGSGSGAAVVGTVSSVNGRTIYVKDSEGTTVAVRVEDGSKISRDSNVGVKKIRPGDSVVVQGAKHGSTVKASSISATESGVETSALGGLPASGGSESERRRRRLGRTLRRMRRDATPTAQKEEERMKTKHRVGRAWASARDRGDECPGGSRRGAPRRLRWLRQQRLEHRRKQRREL